MKLWTTVIPFTIIAAGVPAVSVTTQQLTTDPPQINVYAISTRMNHRPAKYCDAGNILPHDTFDAEYIQDRFYSDKACINMQFKFEMQRIQ